MPQSTQQQSQGSDAHTSDSSAHARVTSHSSAHGEEFTITQGTIPATGLIKGLTRSDLYLHLFP